MILSYFLLHSSLLQDDSHKKGFLVNLFTLFEVSILPNFVWGKLHHSGWLIKLLELRGRLVHEVTSLYTALYVKHLPVYTLRFHM